MAADEGRAAALKGVVGSELHAAVHSARVLVVGAGGIGCELLKNLAMCGFGEVELVSWHLRVHVCLCNASELNVQTLAGHVTFSSVVEASSVSGL